MPAAGPGSPSDAAQEYLEGKRAEEANPPEDPPL